MTPHPLFFPLKALFLSLALYLFLIPIKSYSSKDSSKQQNNRTLTLESAIQSKNTKKALALIQLGVDIDARVSGSEDTLLHIVAQKGFHRIAKALINAGADMNAQNKLGKTPAHVASKWGRVDILNLLKSKGADLEIKNQDGETPFYTASRYNQVRVLRIFLRNKLQPNITNARKETPLHEISRLGNVLLAILFNKHLAYPNAQSETGDTPLHFALLSLRKYKLGDDENRMPFLKFIDTLITNGADPYLKNTGGMSPFSMAKSDIRLTDVVPILTKFKRKKASCRSRFSPSKQKNKEIKNR